VALSNSPARNFPFALKLATLAAMCLLAVSPAMGQGLSFGGDSSQLRGVIVQADDIVNVPPDPSSNEALPC
jgi:hypothetical protein